MVRAGVPEHTAMKISGHRTRSIFDRYDIIDQRDISNAMDRIEAARGKIDTTTVTTPVSTTKSTSTAVN